MRKLINILLTIAVIGGSLAGGSYLRQLSTDTKTRQEVTEDVVAVDSEPLFAKPEFFAYNELLSAQIVKGSDGLQEYIKVPLAWDPSGLRILAYYSLMLSDNASRGSDALNQADLVDSGILLLRVIVSNPDHKYILNSWVVAENQAVQSFADKYIALAKADRYKDKSDIKDLANNLYPQWAADRYMKGALPVYDLSGVKPPNPSSCSVPSVDREALKVEYDGFSPALQQKEYNGSVSLPDSTLNIKDTGANMYESAYSKQLKSLAFVAAIVASSYNEKTKAELGYPVLTLKGEHVDDEGYQEIMSMLQTFYEASIHINSYSSLGIVGSPLDVYALETNDPTLQTTTTPAYLSEHALYWTIAAEYLGHYGLKFKTPTDKDYLNSPLLKGKGPVRFGEGVLYWSAGVDASIVLGKCLVKHYLETGV